MMLGFLKKRMFKEQLKLLYQNGMAIEYLQAFISKEAASDYRMKIEQISETRRQTGEMSDNDTESMLKLNKAFRKLYDQTPGRYTKSFDEEYTPLLGWDEYYTKFL